MVKDLFPVITDVPGDGGRWVYLDGHDLVDSTALNENDAAANATISSAAIFAALNVSSDKGVLTSHEGSGYDMRPADGEPIQTARKQICEEINNIQSPVNTYCR